MSETKHTPGPWTAYPSPKGGYNIRDRWDNVPAIARTFNAYAGARANARLIAAAPDLLEAAREVLAERDGALGPDSVGVLLLRAAIARAEGGDQ